VGRLRDGRAQLNEANESLRIKNEELGRLSVTDQLTGLFNRRRLMEVLEAEVNRSKRHVHPFSILIMDVDHFKKFNDAHGHLAGDRVLAIETDRGILLTPYHPTTERAMAIAVKAARKYRNALRELAK